ncbi:MAG: hypothetical protein II153_02540 [Erysipelotrichaceae bacterium]|nr:hypothetical protein [Erysipelotrichaceae bacterium]MBQ5443958.1 hypothetical protein [Erysipelotrichaceae bacterium]
MENKTYLKETLRKIGCDDEELSKICSYDDPRLIIEKLRRFRCDLMDDYHQCVRKIDDIDNLIRKEKENERKHTANDRRLG